MRLQVVCVGDYYDGAAGGAVTDGVDEESIRVGEHSAEYAVPRSLGMLRQLQSTRPLIVRFAIACAV
jgi:hypothetical protein